MNSIQSVLKRYGNTIVCVSSQTPFSFVGFLQRSKSKSLQNSQRDYCKVGELSEKRYLLLAPTEAVLAVGDVLEHGPLRVKIQTLETVSVKDKPLYQWGLCKSIGGVDTWVVP